MRAFVRDDDRSAAVSRYESSRTIDALATSVVSRSMGELADDHSSAT
jgi:hypothetical protein